MAQTRLDKIVQSLATVKSSWETVFLKNLEFTVTDSVKKKPYSKSALAFACIKTTATAISQVPFVIQERRGDAWEPVNEDNVWQQRFNDVMPYTGR